jgi:hypothetical protein
MEKKYINLLEDIISKGEVIIDFLNHKTSFSVNQNASSGELLKCNLFFDNKIPEDYLFFLRQYNGAILYNFDNFLGFELLNTDRIIEVNKFPREELADYWNDVILFCEKWGGDSEYLGFKLSDDSNYKIIDCCLDDGPEDWIYLNDTFDSFIENLLIEKGKEYWLF